jgi:hypothetical protein
MDALSGIDNFVQQMNSKLAEIPRVITVNVAGLTPATTASTGAVSQGTQAGGIDAEALAEHLYPHIRDRLDAESRLRGMR